jgi:RNA polymerase sigma-70 factor (ECF subfamily)
MTQEVFVRAWQHLDRFRPEDGIAPWLKRVAVNLHINELRKHARRGAAAELPADDRLPGSLPETRPGLDLETAIRRLPEASRTAYVLHDVLGYKHREIAELTGIAVGTAKTHVHRARGRLKRMLGR